MWMFRWIDFRGLCAYIYLPSAHIAVMTAAQKMTLPVLSSRDMKDCDLIHYHYYTVVQIVSICMKNSSSQKAIIWLQNT